jgi:hypothetical protein
MVEVRLDQAYQMSKLVRSLDPEEYLGWALQLIVPRLIRPKGRAECVHIAYLNVVTKSHSVRREVFQAGNGRVGRRSVGVLVQGRDNRCGVRPQE